MSASKSAPRIIFLDTETTGLENGRVIQLAFKERGGTCVVEYYKAPVPIEIEAMATHHITEKKLAGKPSFCDTDTYKNLPKLFKESVVVAHNAAFDVSMLKNEGLEVPRYICTFKVAQTLHDLPRYKLQYLRYLWDVDVEGASAHDAEGDVLVLERVFERMLAEYCQKEGVDEATALARFEEITKNPILLKKLSFGKHAGKTFEEIKRADPSYLQWLGTLADKGEDFQYTVKHHLAR